MMLAALSLSSTPVVAAAPAAGIVVGLLLAALALVLRWKEEEEEEEEEGSERAASSSTMSSSLEGLAVVDGGSDNVSLKEVSSGELAKHASPEDCWVALFGQVYDFTDFVNEHPAGPEAIIRSAGKDGTEEFEAIHSKSMLDDFDPIGILR
mmetsp:Transcript_17781/g.24828  ORF Transcript_17781/g.24828 Transcript_17781/m.24828 type:complete len:151 (-) Transcript_17781:368-820(-)